MEALESGVLLVDDEVNVLASLRRLLRLDGHRVLTAANAEEALQTMGVERVAVIVTDERMPGVNGTELLRIITRMYPRTARIMLSGHQNPDAADRLIKAEVVHRFLPKPWNNEVLRDAVQTAFARYRSSAVRVDCA